MHKMSTNMHKNNTITPEDKNENNLQILSDRDFERENRFSEIISLHSKGLNQTEIAAELKVNQSTISRDIELIKTQARSQLDRFFRNDIFVEFAAYQSGSNQVIKQLWKTVEHCDEPKDRISALKLLSQVYDRRHQRLVEGPDSYLNIKKSGADLDYQDFLDKDAVLKAMDQIQRLDPTFFGGGNSLKKKVK